MMFLVVALHASLAYSRIPLPGLLWTVRDPAPSFFFDKLSWCIEGIAMPCFFFVSGFLAARQYDSLGPAGFLKHRARRLLWPFLAACAVILPLTYYAWAYGWLRSGQCTMHEILAVKFHAANIQRDLFGPAHLWFLEYLVLLSAAYFVLRRFFVPGKVRAALPVFVAASVGVLFWNIGAMFDLSNSFVPALPRILHYAVFFTAGTCLEKKDLEELGRRSTAYLVLSIAAFFFLCRFLGNYLTGAGPEPFFLGISAALFSWGSVLGLTGFFMRHFDRERRAVRFAWDASYWVYLWHFPAVGFFQAALFRVPIAAEFKFFGVLVTALAAGLVSYRFLPRRLRS